MVGLVESRLPVALLESVELAESAELVELVEWLELVELVEGRLVPADLRAGTSMGAMVEIEMLESMAEQVVQCWAVGRSRAFEQPKLGVEVGRLRANLTGGRLCGWEPGDVLFACMMWECRHLAILVLTARWSWGAVT